MYIHKSSLAAFNTATRDVLEDNVKSSTACIITYNLWKDTSKTVTRQLRYTDLAKIDVSSVSKLVTKKINALYPNACVDGSIEGRIRRNCIKPIILEIAQVFKSNQHISHLEDIFRQCDKLIYVLGCRTHRGSNHIEIDLIKKQIILSSFTSVVR